MKRLYIDLPNERNGLCEKPLRQIWLTLNVPGKIKITVLVIHWL